MSPFVAHLLTALKERKQKSLEAMCPCECLIISVACGSSSDFGSPLPDLYITNY